MKLLYTLLLLLGLSVCRSSAQTGIAVPELAHCDQAIGQFMRRWNVLGASVALSKDGRLVYDRAFGYADVARTAPMQPYHLLRVASVSKTVTALAIMKLVEDGQISLSHKVFGPGGYLPGLAYSREIRDRRIYSITVQQLLEHTAGWDRSVGCDGHGGCDPIDFPTQVAQVMHAANPVGDSTIIRYMLRQGLNFAPGARFAYSNVGYLVLGKVLEAVTHQPYEAWVTAHVLQPSGVLEAHLAHNLPAARRERESGYQSRFQMRSCYHPSRLAPAAYGGYQLEAMSAHGGWLFSARDLLRLALAADGFATRPDLLAAATLRTMTQPSAVAAGYAKGWMVNRDSTWWHTGQLDGTASLVVRTAGGYAWAILLNTSNGSPEFWRDLQALGGSWLARPTSWPAQNLFAPEQNATDFRASVADSAHVQLNWAPGNGTHRLVLLRADQPGAAFPLDGTAYQVASHLADSSLVVANNADGIVQLPTLDPDRTYYARLVEYRQDSTTGYRPVYALEGNPKLVLRPGRLAALPLLAGVGDPAPAQPAAVATADGLAYQFTLPGTRSRGAYLRRLRRALRQSVAYLVRL